MKTVFVDASGFYACLDGSDAFHPHALAAFERAEQEPWELVTTNYVVHETWVSVQRHLGSEAVETFLNDLLPRCKIEWVDESAHNAAATRCRQARERRFSLTDTVSLECMSKRGITQCIAQDEYIVCAHIVMP